MKKWRLTKKPNKQANKEQTHTHTDYQTNNSSNHYQTNEHNLTTQTTHTKNYNNAQTYTIPKWRQQQANNQRPTRKLQTANKTCLLTKWQLLQPPILLQSTNNQQQSTKQPPTNNNWKTSSKPKVTPSPMALRSLGETERCLFFAVSV